MPFLIFLSESFAVQYRDHFRSGIICGPIRGSFAARDHLQSWDHLRTRTVLPEKLGKGVRPASQNPYPIYGPSLRFSLPYL